MDEPVKNSIWNYLIPLHYLEQVSSILERRGVEVSLTSHFFSILQKTFLFFVDKQEHYWYYMSCCCGCSSMVE